MFMYRFMQVMNEQITTLKNKKKCYNQKSSERKEKRNKPKSYGKFLSKESIEKIRIGEIQFFHPFIHVLLPLFLNSV